jgi:energy-coupling factor transporter ATP-binding protein EcfA2
MFFEIKNLGIIKQAKVKLGKLTVICGPNNTGKTYITYSLYGLLSHLREKPLSRFLRAASSYFKPIFKSIDKDKLYADFQKKGIIRLDLKEAEKDLNNVVTLLSQLYTEKLKEIFSANANELANAQFRIAGIDDILFDYSKIFELKTSKYDAVKEKQSRFLEINLHSAIRSRWLIDFIIDDALFEFFLFKDFPNPFILTAERAGIHLFQKELENEWENCLTKTRPLELKEKFVRLALPIAKNIDFVKDSEVVINYSSFLTKPELTSYIEDMLGVQYEIVDGRRMVRDKTTLQPLPCYMSSTSVRALFDLHLWLKHQAQKGDLLFLDEPELNLHPKNQLKIARLLVKLVNNGINVFITTHSDYLIKEFNNMLMLANDFPEKAALMNELGYAPDEVLQPEDFKVYIAHTDGTISLADVDKYGMNQTGFDDTIVQINKTSNKLISAIDRC